MAVQYETKATNVGGRKGHVHTDDNAINVDVLPPQQADG
ncbi:MAG: peroxiredoxin, partial [Staphylococcus epidermidis]|nr:peroxiredoxin [Staphylococcus epidermidis]